MTPQQIKLIHETFPAVREYADSLSNLFYGRLFQATPSLRSMFHGDIRAQGRKFTEMLFALADHLNDFDQHLPRLWAMGQRHIGYGVQPEHYLAARDALNWALRQVFSDSFSPEAQSAWITLIEQVSAVMLSGAAQLPIQNEAAAEN